MISDFNVEPEEIILSIFLHLDSLKSLVKQNTLQKPRKPSCMDLILVNSSCSFQNTTTYVIRLLDCNKTLRLYKTGCHRSQTTFSQTKTNQQL